MHASTLSFDASRRWGAWFVAWLFLAAFALAPRAAHAHKASDAYLQLKLSADEVELRWDIALRDLDAALDIDRNGDRKLSWGEVKSSLDDIRDYAFPRLRLQQGRCELVAASPPGVDDRIDGAYLVFQFKSACALASGFEIDYQLFRDVDPTHRGLLRVEGGDGRDPTARSLDPSGGPVSVTWSAAPPPAHSSFFLDGVHHILIGYDHVLFLICLLLPSVLRRRRSGWTPVLTWREAAWPMLGIVTMFTLAHSLTLALAGLGFVSISPRIVEPAITLTIVLAALDNIRPLLGGRRKLFGFVFGLIHGFGFAGALAELDLPVRGLALALLQFNLGVEAGQLLVVFAALGALLAVRNWRRYEPVLLRAGSTAAVLLASVWFVERAFDLKVMPFS